MNTTTSLTDLIAAVTAHEGSWGQSRMEWDKEANAYLLSRRDEPLAWDVDFFLWAGDMTPTMPSSTRTLQAGRLTGTDYMTTTATANSAKDEVLSVLFGLHHRTRIIDWLWTGMFERGVTQKLLGRLLALEADKC